MLTCTPPLYLLFTGLGIFITICIIALNFLFMLNVVWTLVQHSQYCDVCKRKNETTSTSTGIIPSAVASQANYTHVYAALKFQQNVRDALRQRATQNTTRSGRENRVKRQDTAAVAKMIVKSASAHANHKKDKLEKERKKSLSRLDSRLAKRKSRSKITPKSVVENKIAENEDNT